MAYYLTTFPEDDMCPKICTETGGYIKSDKNPEVMLDEIKEAKLAQKVADLKAKVQETAAAPAPPQPEPVMPAPPTEEYLPELKPGQNGKIDWTPLADMTGTRPAVSKYSLSRYSLKEWKKRGKEILDPDLITQSNVVDYNAKSAMMQAFGNVDKQQGDNNRRLKQKARDIFRWKVEVEEACKAITAEVELLEIDRQRLKGASRTLMLPESISRECLSLRSKRFQPDLVSDFAEQELTKEMNLVAEVRATLKRTLESIEEQLQIDKAVKHRIEYDWCDKTLAYDTEAENIRLNPKSKTILFRPGATRFGDFSAPLEYWEFFCRENIENCEAARQKSADLRSTLNAILVNNGRKLRTQADRTDMALAETVAIQTELCTKLEQQLKETLQKIADLEALIAELQEAMKKMDAAMKLAQTRLDNRNTWRQHGESVRDQPHLGLLQEVKLIHESVTALRMQLNNAEKVRSGLIDKRKLLERDIASKRMTLNIDRDRCGLIRSHYPSASELAGF